MPSYSNTPLAKKLGVPMDAVIAVLGAPAPYARLLSDLPEGVRIKNALGRGSYGFIHFFSKSRSELREKLPALKKALTKDGLLWISWPKKASQLETDLTDQAVREIGIACGLVDVKVCSVNDIWSGLKFVYRKKDRE